MSPPEPKVPIISRSLGLIIVVVLVIGRSLAPLVWSDVYFDADQAVTGLMAKHISEGRAFPVFQYGAPYVLVLEAYLAAPLVAIAGPSPIAVRLVPFAFNVAAAALLYGLLTRDATLRPAFAVLATLPVALPGASAGNDLTAALGMNIEPLFFSLLIWALRAHPIPLGLVAAIAVKNREFAAYALAAMLFLDILRDRSATLWRPRIAAMIAFALAWSAIGLLYQHSSVLGPGTSASMQADGRDNVAVAASAVCIAPERIPGDLRMVVSELLPLQWGVRSARWRVAAIPGQQPLDASWLWVPLSLVLTAAIARGVWRAWTAGPRPLTWFGLFLVMIGMQAVLAYGLTRCGNASFFTLRYMLLSIFIPAGALVLGLERERTRVVQFVLVTACVLWFGVVAIGHFIVFRGFLAEPPIGSYRQLANYLVEHDVRFIRSDYWTGYHVAFLTGERVRALTNFDRVLDHQLAVTAHLDEAVVITRRENECSDSTQVGVFYLCPPQTTVKP